MSGILRFLLWIAVAALGALAVAVAAFQRSEIERWARLVKNAGIEPE